MSSKLDRFPIEIFHMIFDYLQPFDLLRAFTEVNSYIDMMLYSYSRIRLNCKSMTKSTFDYTCEHIFPNQIQSLILSDDSYTPGQIKLFMSLVPLIQCMNLELINIKTIDDVKLLCLILSHLENHPKIRSLAIVNYCMDLSRKNARYITEVLTSLLALKYLTYHESSTLSTLRRPLLKLTHLTINSCQSVHLKNIFPWIPNLVYLKATFSHNSGPFVFDYIPLNLNSLIIESQRWTLFSEVENMLSLAKSLKCFIFSTSGELTLVDGRRWETLIKNNLSKLTEFALNIAPDENNMDGDEVLLPFESTFWKNEKHWYMACLLSLMSQSCARLYSIPYFSPSDVWYPQSEGFINYSITPYSFNDHYTKLYVHNLPSPAIISSPFKNIRTLSVLFNINDMNELKQVVNLLPVQHLILNFPIEYISLYDLLIEGSNIYQLTIVRSAARKIMDLFPNDRNRYEQIKELNIQQPISSCQIDQICQKFPKLEFISLYIKQSNDIFRILKGFHQLSSATIHWRHACKNPLLMTDECLMNNGIYNFSTYYFSPFSLSIWMDQNKSI